ncbi:MAG: hydroxyphenylacetyl-CoA thioesterase PaaI [Gammaproteobacteria bacterium]|jgi:acyl-CoA thioesterase
MDEDHNPGVLAQKCAEAMWPRDRASQALDIKLVSMDEGRAIMTMEVKDYMLNGYDLCHGGYIFALADDAFAYACNSQNQAAVASSCSIDFIRPAYAGETLTARAELLHRSGRSGLYDVMVTNDKGEAVAHFRGRSSRLNRPVIPEEPDNA